MVKTKTTTARRVSRSGSPAGTSGPDGLAGPPEKLVRTSAFRERERLPRSTQFSFAVLLFLSGAAALIYQVLWIKQLSLVVGAEVFSITIAVSAFFGGLALGGAFFGRMADRLAHPLLLYSALEAGIAALGTLATLLLSHSAAPFAAIESRAGLLAWVLPFGVVGAPAFLMGGTLPLAIRTWARERGSIAAAGGSVYATNTAGGIAGALLSSFVLLPGFGVRGTCYAAALLNVAAATVAFDLNRRSQRERFGTVSVPRPAHSPDARFALILYTLAGGIALGYEVVWSQAIVQFLSTRTFAFSIVLATYLAGLATGGALYSHFAGRFSKTPGRSEWGVFGLLICGAGLIGLLELATLSVGQLQIQAEIGRFIFAATGSEFARMCTHFLIAALGIVFVPTVLLGAAFPAALRIATRHGSVGRDVGTVLALNTTGGIAGSLLTGFLLVPSFGLVRTSATLAIGAAVIGIAAVLRSPGSSVRLRWSVIGIGIATLIVGFITPPDRLGRLLTSTRGGGTLTFYEEGLGVTVAVVGQGSGDRSFRRLYIQGTSNSGDALPSLRYMRLQALLPLILHKGEPRSALVIGYGTGITAGALLQYPSLQKTVCTELLPEVVNASPLFTGNFHAARDPNLEIRVRDGRRELMQSSEQYDLITLEPPPPSASGVVNLYSTNFYQLAARRLQPDGLVAQWLPLTTQNDQDTRSLVQSFLNVFPYATLWTTELHETLLIGSFSPIELDAQKITSHFNQPKVAAALGEAGVNSPATLLATWMMDRAGLVRYADDAQPVTDDRPRIEYAAWVRPDEITRVLPELLTYRSTVPLHGGVDGALRAEIEEQQNSLLQFYAAGVSAYNGDRDSWQKEISAALQNHQDNPYYRWILGEVR